MRPYPNLPRTHFFVCANRRNPNDPLGAGCGDRGDAVYAALKDEVARRGAFRAVWVTRTQCLGVCPRQGCTVAVYPRAQVLADVSVADARALFDAEVGT
jgi:(2Fe-2S) ferredoxin